MQIWFTFIIITKEFVCEYKLSGSDDVIHKLNYFTETRAWYIPGELFQWTIRLTYFILVGLSIEMFVYNRSFQTVFSATCNEILDITIANNSEIVPRYRELNGIRTSSWMEEFF